MQLRSFTQIVLTLSFLLFLTPSVKAQTFEIQSGVYTANGFYVGPLGASLDGDPITVYCDDFDHEVNFGDSWQVTVNTFQDIPDTRWQDLRKYENIAFLIEQMNQDLPDVGAIQEAIWMEDSSNPALVNTQSTYWFNLAASQDFTNTDFSEFRILTPTDPNNYQEMIDVVPEPSTIAMAILGLGLVVVAVRRKA